MPDDSESLKIKTARSVKWNLVDRVSTQVLYAVTGIVLARMLSQEDFGLVGAVLVFQAFASLLIDSGFASALMQRKNPTRLDYSSVMWFNFGMAIVLYVVLWFCAPLIASCFQGDQRLVPLSRVMFLSIIINSGVIVQANILMKKMDVRMIALSNATGLVAGSVVGIALAVNGYGAWSIVWQTITLAVVKTGLLWTGTRWRPVMRCSWDALKSFVPIGSRMMLTSFLSTLFQNIYSFFVGNRVGLGSLGYYTQADKWSKMSVTSVSQVLGFSFLPTLSAVQDEPDRFRRICSKMNRFAAYVAFPATVMPAVLAMPVFHVLFGNKWDPSVILFQLMLLRGVFTVFCSLYGNYLLAIGRARAIVLMETLRDCTAIVALIATMPYMAITGPGDPVRGLAVMMWGQVAASALTWMVTLAVTARASGATCRAYLRDLLPCFVLSAIAVPLMIAVRDAFDSDWTALLSGAVTGLAFYLGANALFGSKIQKDVLAYLTRRR